MAVQNVLAQDPTSFEALFQDGLMNLAKSKAAQAIREFEYLSNIYHGSAKVRYQLARAYLLYAKDANATDSRAAVDNADSRLSEAIKLNPHFEEAVELFADIKIHKAAAAAAVDPLMELIKGRPQETKAYYLLASAYSAQQRTDQALAVYRRTAELFPRDPQPRFLIGTILLSQNQPLEARKAFEK